MRKKHVMSVVVAACLFPVVVMAASVIWSAVPEGKAVADQPGVTWVELDKLMGGESKRVQVRQASAERLRLRCTRGAVIIKSVTLRTGGRPRKVAPNRRLVQGESYTLKLGKNTRLTAVEVESTGTGTFLVEVQ